MPGGVGVVRSGILTAPVPIVWERQVLAGNARFVMANISERKNDPILPISRNPCTATMRKQTFDLIQRTGTIGRCGLSLNSDDVDS
jgi:hypothetical protein